MMKKSLLFLAFIAIAFASMAQADTATFPLPQEYNYANYPEGNQALEAFLQQNIVYPEYEKSMKIEGTVVVGCDVAIDGTLSNFKVVFGVDEGTGLDAEALRVCQKIEKFTPCMKNGNPIVSNTHIYVKFDLYPGNEMEMAVAKLSKKELKDIEKDAREMCEMINDIIELQIAGDTIRVEAYRKSCAPKMAKLEKKYPKRSAYSEKLKEFVKPCMEEVMKISPMSWSQILSFKNLSRRDLRRIEKDAKVFCALLNESIIAKLAEDTKKMEELQMTLIRQWTEMEKKYPKGSFKPYFEKLVMPCLQDAMKLDSED
jgi:TonB family protein